MSRLTGRDLSCVFFAKEDGEVKMKKIVIAASVAALVAGCAVQTATPLAGNVAQIDISAAPVYGRAGAQRMAIRKAAQTTIDYGFDKFVVLDNHSWNEATLSAGSYGSFSANRSYAGGGFNSYASEIRRPEAKMVIKMFKATDKEAANAIDAKALLASDK